MARRNRSRFALRGHRENHQDTAPEWHGYGGVPEAVRLLGEEGCVLCRSMEQAASAWVRWFAIESHSDPPALLGFQNSLGFCAPHTRLLLGLGSPRSSATRGNSLFGARSRACSAGSPGQRRRRPGPARCAAPPGRRSASWPGLCSP